MHPFAESFKGRMADADESQPLVCDNGTGMVKVRGFKTFTSCILYFKHFTEGKGRPLVSQIFFSCSWQGVSKLSLHAFSIVCILLKGSEGCLLVKYFVSRVNFLFSTFYCWRKEGWGMGDTLVLINGIFFLLMRLQLLFVGG